MQRIEVITVAVVILIYVLLFKNLKYINEIENCQCFNQIQEASKYDVDIGTLRAYQIFEMIYLGFFLVIFFVRAKVGKMIKNNNGLLLRTAIGVSVLVVLYLNITIIYNSFLLYVMSSKECECIDKWQKYYIYIQGVSGASIVLRLLSLILFTVFAFAFLR